MILTWRYTHGGARAARLVDPGAAHLDGRPVPAPRTPPADEHATAGVGEPQRWRHARRPVPVAGGVRVRGVPRPLRACRQAGRCAQQASGRLPGAHTTRRYLAAPAHAAAKAAHAAAHPVVLVPGWLRNGLVASILTDLMRSNAL